MMSSLNALPIACTLLVVESAAMLDALKRRSVPHTVASASRRNSNLGSTKVMRASR
jgi:hypothetical protein